MRGTDLGWAAGWILLGLAIEALTAFALWQYAGLGPG